MAYVKPHIRLRENNRHIARGFYYDAQIGRFVLDAANAETVKAVIDYTDLLDGATISVATATNGLTCTSTASGGVVTLTLSGVMSIGDLDITTTFSDGRIQQDYLRLNDPFAWSKDDYGPAKIPA